MLFGEAVGILELLCIVGGNVKRAAAVEKGVETLQSIKPGLPVIQ